MKKVKDGSSLDELKDLLAKRALVRSREARIVSPAGEPQAWLFDIKGVMLEGPVLEMVVDCIWQKIKSELPFQLCALETAGIALVAGVVLRARQDGVNLNGLYMRKSRKKDGLQKIIEGRPNNEKVILLDDATNSGRSLVRQIEALHLIGNKVHAVCSIVHFRDESFYDYFRESGIKLFSLFTLDDFPATGGLKEYARLNAVKTPAKPQSYFKTEWKFQSENPSYFHILPKSAPAIDEKRVYFGADNGTLWALNQSDGSVAWSFKTLFGAGDKRIFSSPAISQDLVYFGAYDGNVYALDAETGKKKWVYLEADWIGSSPCVAEDLGLVFVGLEFGLINKHGGIAALDAKTGEKQWWQIFETQAHSSPSYSKKHGIVVVGSSAGIVYAFNAKTGKPIWKYATSGAVRAGFAFDDARELVCFGSEDKNIYALNIKNGTVVHAVPTMEPAYSSPLVENGRLYMGALDKQVYCIDLNSGAVLWRHWTHSRVFASPVLVEGNLYIGSNDGRLYDLDPETGKETAYFQAPERIVNKVAYNPQTKRFFVPTYANELYCLSKKERRSTEHERDNY